jgi:cell division protein FtsI (penicillin-binding protein 3)
MRSADLRRAVLRVRIVGLGLLACFVLLGVRATVLSLVPSKAHELAPKQAYTVLQLAPARGVITDRRGAPLALTVPAPSLYAIPKRVEDVPATARALAKVLGTNERAIEERLRLGSGFAFVSRWIDAKQAAAISALALPGIGLISEPRRTYPQGALAGRIIGFSNLDGEGVRGIEQSEQKWLAGHADSMVVKRDARGRILAEAGRDLLSTAGGDVALTLDSVLQAEAEAALADTVRATGAKGGLVIALDPASGDLLALAEAPAFDPNAFRKAKLHDSRSRIFTDALEPGSTFKTFAIAGALQHGAIRARDVFDCENGAWRVPGKTLRDTHPERLLDVGGVLQKSSNICAAKIGYALGAERHHATLAAFGFGSRSASGFPGESAGLLRNWRGWRPVDHATVSYGQGVSVTALQLAAATAAIANGGILHQPRLVLARRTGGGAWEKTAHAPGRRALREEVAAQVRDMLEGVVHVEGTALRASLVGVRTGGKTGTAQVLDPETRRYFASRYLNWFIGAAPIDAPRVVVVAMVEEPRGVGHTGGATAAPLFARAAAAALARRDIRTQPVFGLPDWSYVGWTPAGGVPDALKEIRERWPSAAPEVGRALIAAQTPNKPDALPPRPALQPAALPAVGAPPPSTEAKAPVSETRAANDSSVSPVAARPRANAEAAALASLAQ